MKLKVLELFCGAGSFSVNMTSNKIKHEIVGFSDIRKSAIELFCKIHNKDKNDNLGDITQASCVGMEVDLLVFGSPCFAAGTRIITDKGYKNIEDVKINDLVLTHHNRYRKVLKTGGDFKEIYTLKAQGIKLTETTENHPYYVRERTKDGISDPIWKKVKDINKGDYVALPIINIEKNDYNLNEEDCWLLGRYLADGHYRNDKRKGRINSYFNQVIYSIGNSKLEEFKSKVSRHYSCYPHSQSVHRCVISSKKMVELLKNENFGKGALNKRIPQFVLELPKNLANEVLEGYMSGDGSLSNGEYKANSVSEELIMGLNLLIAKCKNVNSGYGYFERPKKCTIQGREVNQNDSYYTSFRNEMKHSSKAKVINDMIWLPIKEINKTKEIKQVYNLEVEEDNSYTANNAVVHNCQSFSRTGKSEGGAKGSKTKSSLMWEAVRIMEETKPKWIIWENVPDAISTKHFENFQNYMDELDEIGYNTYYKVLYAYELGSAQKRRRLFSISVRKDVDNGKFKFEYDIVAPKKLKSLLESSVSSEYIVEDKIKEALVLGKTDEGYMIKNATKQGYLIANEGDAIDTGFYNSKTRRGRVQKDACQTLLRSKTIATMRKGELTYLTPLEYWRLQEMPEDLYGLVDECEFTMNEKYDVIGGVINQAHLNVVFKSLIKAFDWELEN